MQNQSEGRTQSARRLLAVPRRSPKYAIAVQNLELHVSTRAHRHCFTYSFSLRKQRASFSNSLASPERIGFWQFGLGRCIDSVQLYGGPCTRKCHSCIMDLAAVASTARLC